MRKTRQMHSRGKDKIMTPKLLTILAVLGCVALMTGCEPNVPDTSNTTPNITIPIITIPVTTHPSPQ